MLMNGKIMFDHYHCITSTKQLLNLVADQRLCFHYIDSQSLYFLNPKFQASTHLLPMYSLLYVGPGWKL